jgi:signal peptidase II
MSCYPAIILCFAIGYFLKTIFMPLTAIRTLFLLFVATLVLGIDAMTKYWTQSHLPLASAAFPSYPYGGIAIFDDLFGISFSITHTINKGAAWGLFSQFQSTLLIARCLMIAALFVYLIAFNQKKSWQIPLVLIIAGAFGNVLDYFLYGHVIDMLNFEFWGYMFPTFNISDSAIFLGIVSMIYASREEIPV